MDELTKQAIDALRAEQHAADERLHDHIEAQKVSVAAALTTLNDRWAASDRAVELALQAADKRLDIMNEFRATLSDQARDFARRTDLEAARNAGLERHEAGRLYTDQQIGALKESRAEDAKSLENRLARMVEARNLIEASQSSFIKRDEFEDVKRWGQGLHDNNREFVVQQIETKLQPVVSDITRLQRPNWSALAVVVSMAIGIIAGGWLIVGLKIDSSVAPLGLAIETLRTQTAQNTERMRGVETTISPIAQNSTTSLADRAQLNERVRHLETVLPTGATAVSDLANVRLQVTDLVNRVVSLRTDQSRQDQALVEIETQFCGQDNLRNQIHAQDLRWFSMLWRKAYGDEMPTANAYYARVGRCAAQNPAN